MLRASWPRWPTFARRKSRSIDGMTARFPARRPPRIPSSEGVQPEAMRFSSQAEKPSENNEIKTAARRIRPAMRRS